MTELIFIRHGQTDWNLDSRLQGIMDIPLNATGIREAENLTLGLDLSAKLIISSPLQRAFKTAEIINSKLNLDIQVDDRLIERDFGEFSGLKTCSFESMENSDINGVEDIESFREKVMSFLKNYESRTGERYLIVTHGGVISTILNTISNGSLTWQNAPINNCSITSFQFTNNWNIGYYNSPVIKDYPIQNVKESIIS